MTKGALWNKMGLFLATHINKIDSKGRLSVPATFRAALPASHSQTIVLVPSFRHAALEGFSLNTVEELSQRMDHFDLFSDEQDDLSTALFSQAVPLSFDDNGRITLPQALIGHAELDGSAAFVGMGKKFQVWNPDKLEQRQSSALDTIREKGLTLPANAKRDTREDN